MSSPPESRNWEDLPRDVTETILMKLGAIEILTSAQRVCRLWWNICKNPLMWRTIDIQGAHLLTFNFDLESMCRHAIDRSSGHLLHINLEHTDHLLNYITLSTCHLQRLRLVYCNGISDEVLSELAKKLPCLEELDISICNISKDALEAVGRCCPLLKSFKFNMVAYRIPIIEYNEGAFAIAQTMPDLRHLQLFGNKLTNDGLLAILVGCPRLESLDLRGCFNVNLGGSLGRRCAEQIKDLRHPYASTDDYPLDAEINDQPFDGDYMSGIDIEYLSDDDWEYYAFLNGLGY